VQTPVFTHRHLTKINVNAQTRIRQGVQHGRKPSQAREHCSNDCGRAACAALHEPLSPVSCHHLCQMGEAIFEFVGQKNKKKTKKKVIPTQSFVCNVCISGQAISLKTTPKQVNSARNRVCHRRVSRSSTHTP
jgi:hypothetical protein